MHPSFRLLLFVPVFALALFAGMFLGVIYIWNVPPVLQNKWVITIVFALGLYFVRPFEEKYIWKREDDDNEVLVDLPPFATMFVAGILLPFWTNLPELLEQL